MLTLLLLFAQLLLDFRLLLNHRVRQVAVLHAQRLELVLVVELKALDVRRVQLSKRVAQRCHFALVLSAVLEDLVLQFLDLLAEQLCFLARVLCSYKLEWMDYWMDG